MGQLAGQQRANAGDGTVSQFTISADGTLTPMAPPTVAAGTGVRRLALDPAGHFAYAVNPGSGNVTAYSMAANGALRLANGPGGWLARTGDLVLGLAGLYGIWAILDFGLANFQLNI